MNITPEFMRYMGSGADPNDQECVFGYNYFVGMYNSIKEIIDNNNGVLLLSTALDVLKRDIENGGIEKELGDRFVLFLTKLKNNPRAIEYFKNNCIYHQEYKVFKETNLLNTVDSLEKAKESIDEYISKDDNLFELVKVNKAIVKSNQMTLVNIKHESEIVQGYTYFVFSPHTGKNKKVEDIILLKEEINKIYEQEINYLKRKYTIKQKIEDSQEGYIAWKDVTHVS